MTQRGFLGLGTNLGDRKDNLRRTLAALKSCAKIEVVRVSQVYETAPQGVLDQPDFLNLVVEIATELSPRELLTTIKAIELQLGRTPGPRWGPRLIDIDILLLGDERIAEEGLTLPHPHLLERAFVMAPLAELAPELILQGERADAIAARLAKEQKIGANFRL